MANQPRRTLTGETLRRNSIQHGPVNEILSMSCSPSDSDSSSVSLSNPEPFKCQLRLERVAPQCREFCRRSMSQEAIQCENNHCRQYLLMNDTETAVTYRGFATLVRYLLDPTGHLARITLLIPLISRIAEQIRGWTFIGRDPPAWIHDYWRTFHSPHHLECAIEDITFSPSTSQGMTQCLDIDVMPSGHFGSQRGSISTSSASSI